MKSDEKLVACEFMNERLRKENEKLKDALQESFRYESSQYNAFLAIKKAQEKNLEKAGLKAT